MTKKARRREESELIRKGILPAKPTKAAADESDYRRDSLDSTLQEVIRGTVADNPFSSPSSSPEVATALAMVNAALRWAGMAHAPLQLPDEAPDIMWVFQEAGLTGQETRAWELHCAGFSVQTIAVFMDVKQPDKAGAEDLAVETVRRYIRSGRSKLAKLARA